MTRLRTVVALAVVAALVLGGCADDDTIVLEATFDDVMDLTEHAMVRAGDVTIGTVVDLRLTDDDRAHATLHVEPGSGLPAEVEAVVAQTSLLGERYIELRPLRDGGELASGTIARTSVISDLEQLVRTGNGLLAGVAADRLAAAVEGGAIALGGRGSTLGSLLDRLGVLAAGYRDGTDDVVRLIEASDELLGAIATAAEADAAALADLERAAGTLAEEDERLLDALDELARLSRVAGGILAEHRGEVDRGIHRLRLVLEDLLRIDGALDDLLTWLPRHNLHVANGVLDEMSQVWNDFSVCGEHDDPDDPSNTCAPRNPGEPNEPPPSYGGPDDCDLHHRGCPYPDGVEPRGGGAW